MVVSDGFSVFVNALLLLTGLLGVALAFGYVKRMGIERGEFYTLMLFSISGMMLMAQSADLIAIFLALELLSLPLYVLSAFARPRADSEESGLKYFLLGAFSSGFVLYGIALVYGATGSTSLSGIVAAISNGTPGLLLTIGAALILVGLGFKVAAVPFHRTRMSTRRLTASPPSWRRVPDRRFRCPAARVCNRLPSISADITPVLQVLSALTMIVGNLIAISQSDIKRMLAYSSIAHAGYILMAFVPYGNPEVRDVSIAAGLFYLVSYAFTNFGAWGVVMLWRREGKGLAISDYAGLGRKYLPWRRP
jgi:NADH-quinone oxidoreductase subunit N